MELQGMLTQRGKALLLSALSGSAVLTFTRAAAGSGMTPDTATALASEQQTLGLNPVQKTSSSIVLPVVFTAAQAQQDYHLTEVGIYAQDGAGESLYSVYRLDEPLGITAGGSLTVRFALEEFLGGEAAVTVQSPGLLSEDDMANLVPRFELDNLVPRSELDNLVPRSELDNLVVRSELDNLVPRTELSNLVSQTQLQNLRGQAGGLATLDAGGTVPVGQMPYTSSTTDLEAGVSALATGKLHFVYE